MDLVEHEGDFQGEVVSSSWVREALAEGDVAAAAYCLGRPYRLILENTSSGNGSIDVSSTSTDTLVYLNQPPAVGQYNCLAHVVESGNAVQHVNHGSPVHVVLGEHGEIQASSTINKLIVPQGGMLVLDFLDKS